MQQQASPMDVSARYPSPRAQMGTLADPARNGMPDDSSGNECELDGNYVDKVSNITTNNSPAESLIRRKFQRTAGDTNSNSGTAFRKPSLPASAAKQQLEHGSSLSHRRRSTLRDNVRVPSGPREFPSPGKRIGNGNSSSIVPLAAPLNDSNNSRSFLPNIHSEPLFSNTIESSRFSFGLPPSNINPSLNHPGNRSSGDFDLIPAVNFDDFQTSLASYDGPLLSGFPTIGGRSALPADLASGMSKSGGVENLKPRTQKSETTDDPGSLGRSDSFRRRLSVAGSKQSAQLGRPAQAPSQGGGLSLRTRRQSSAAPPPLPGAGVSTPLADLRPRKSVGPGLITSLMDNRKISNPLPYGSEMTSRQAPERVDSLNKTSRRTTMQPSTGSADFQRNPSFAATTQARANKVKSLYAPPRDSEPGTPNGRSVSKVGASRAQTPSSSGNKRQSTVSGRASGLGARTVSPTDTRRLQRLSMMQAPPVPSTTIRPPTVSQDDLPPQLRLDLPDVSRLTQPSPSMIPRKSSNPTPNSVREPSPDIRPSTSSAPTLSSKSSVQSLLPSSASASRLPTPKPRHVHSSSAQYNDGEEHVPPVPAIPKAYESPRDAEPMPFSMLSKSSFSGLNYEPTLGDFDTDGSILSTAVSLKSSRSQPESLNESERRPPPLPTTRSHRRTNTFENIERSIAAAASTQQRPNYDNAGRKNSNLQPLRLPPLNLMPINNAATSKISGMPRPSQEVEDRDDAVDIQTPEPRRIAKTPSTPMTASKATFWRRQDDEYAKQKMLRSSSSQYALRDLMQIDDDNSKFHVDAESQYGGNQGVPVTMPKSRSAITPFASGSLPKNSSEYVRMYGRPSVEYGEELGNSKRPNLQLQTAKPQGPRPSRSETVSSVKPMETPSSVESPVLEATQLEGKKENTGGIRRRLSMSWRRSSSKSVHQIETKQGPRQDDHAMANDLEKAALAQKQAHEMPPPKLPASATWSGEFPTVPRLSLDSTRRKSVVPHLAKLATGANVSSESLLTASVPKTKSLHSEQPQPIAGGNRASSWGNIGTSSRGSSIRSIPNLVKSRHSAAPTFSAVIKDKDDIAADEEMRKLSQKRKDVDSAARESESLKQRAIARSPMTPERVLHDPSCALNIFERGEIMDYEKEGVYFTGTKSARKIVGSLTSSDAKNSKAGNYGYDDERGDYNIVMGDHLAYRYEVVDILGKGSFGQVVRCVDHKDGGVVAVKIIRNKKRFHQQALVEVGILGRLRDWDPEGTYATLSITSSFYFRSHLCIVTPCLSINLYELIRAHNFVGFSLTLIRRFARQLLACLVLLQNKRIIHCDMKPENILLCEARKADVRVIDFGSSCKEEEKVYTYIQSRFYRSPEVILGSSYGLGIDMWSFGCILAELWTGYPIFPGENEQEQLACIMEIFGPPDRHLVDRCTRKKLFFDSVGKPRVTVSSKGRRRRPSSKTLAQALKSDDEAFLDFITRCLRWDPDRRLKPNEAISHPFITNQPLSQRSGIPDEARRAARVKSTTAVPAPNTTSAPSPVKRTQPTASSVAAVNPGNTPSAQQTPAQQTPSARERARPLPETPQTMLRAGPQSVVSSSSSGQVQSSPSKQPLGVIRRHSSVASAAAVAGSKRQSNGNVVGVNYGPGAGQRYGSSGNLSTTSLAQMAARESMGATAAANAARWKAG